MTAILNRPTDETFHVLVARPVRAPQRPAINDPGLSTDGYNRALSRYLRRRTPIGI